MSTISGFEILEVMPNFSSAPIIMARFEQAHMFGQDPSQAAQIFSFNERRIRHSLNHQYVKSKANIRTFEKFFQSRLGQYENFWLPSWHSELNPLSISQDGTNTFIIITSIDYQNVYAIEYPEPSEDYYVTDLGRHIFLHNMNGTKEYFKVIDAVNNGDGTDTLTLDHATVNTWTLGKYYIGFLYWVRFASDTLKIEWDGGGRVGTFSIGYKECLQYIPPTVTCGPYNPHAKATIVHSGSCDTLEISLVDPSGLGTIHFTTDGTRPDATSDVYSTPLTARDVNNGFFTIKAIIYFAGDTEHSDISQEYIDAWTGCSLGDVTPNITNSNVAYWQSEADLPGGQYSVTCVSGAKRDNNGQAVWGVNHDFGLGLGYRIKFNGGSSTKAGPGVRTGYSTFAAAQTHNTGSFVTFTHSSGSIGIYLHDDDYGNNGAGAPNPTFRLIKIS